MDKNYFVIEYRLPGLNEYTNDNRSHAQEGARVKRETENIIMTFITIAKRRGTLKPTPAPVRVNIEWHEKTRKRDPDNIVFAKKFILDALVKCGIIQNDTQKYIRGFREEIINDTSDFVRVELEDVEEPPEADKRPRGRRDKM